MKLIFFRCGVVVSVAADYMLYRSNLHRDSVGISLE
jgi:hypothetical protein